MSYIPNMTKQELGKIRKYYLDRKLEFIVTKDEHDQ